MPYVLVSGSDTATSSILSGGIFFLYHFFYTTDAKIGVYLRTPANIKF